MIALTVTIHLVTLVILLILGIIAIVAILLQVTYDGAVCYSCYFSCYL